MQMNCRKTMGRTTKAEIKQRLDEADAKNRVFFLYEFIQRAENGRSPVPNEANLGHGEPVYVVKKRELMELLAGVRPMVRAAMLAAKSEATRAPAREAMAIIDRVLADDQFVAPLRQLGTPKVEE
jgi:hypothetical protein